MIGEIDPELQKIKEELSRLARMDLNDYSEVFLKRRLNIRLKDTNKENYKDYLQYLKENTEEVQKLRDEISINVTHFFRDYSMWESFRKEVLAEVIKIKRSATIDKTVKIWSAGCSSGEELTSILITFLEEMKGAQDVKIDLSGSDFDQDIVDKARKGVYEEMQFREMPEEYKKKYFNDIGNGLFETKPELKAKLHFEKRNILHESLPKNFDIIFCRNTVIYFSLEAKKILYQKFYDSLKKEGYLIIGKTEILQGDAKDKFKNVNTRERIYSK